MARQLRRLRCCDEARGLRRHARHGRHRGRGSHRGRDDQAERSACRRERRGNTARVRLESARCIGRVLIDSRWRGGCRRGRERRDDRRRRQVERGPGDLLVGNSHGGEHDEEDEGGDDDCARDRRGQEAPVTAKREDGGVPRRSAMTSFLRRAILACCCCLAKPYSRSFSVANCSCSMASSLQSNGSSLPARERVPARKPKREPQTAVEAAPAVRGPVAFFDDFLDEPRLLLLPFVDGCRDAHVGQRLGDCKEWNETTRTALRLMTLRARRAALFPVTSSTMSRSSESGRAFLAPVSSCSSVNGSTCASQQLTHERREVMRGWTHSARRRGRRTK